MTESKIELTERLRREGRWEEASRFKDVALKDRRSNGMTKAEAGEEAWAAMAKAYPPLPAPEGHQAVPIAKALTASASNRGQAGQAAPSVVPGAEEYDVDALLERVGDRQPPDLVRDTLWVYQNMENRKAKPENAPSLGVWSLLQWARQYRNRFFEQVLPKAIAAHGSDDEREQRRERKSIAEIERMLEGLNQQWAEELAASVPETVRAKVRSILEDWARRSALTVPSGAKADLEAHIGGLVRDCMHATAASSGGR